MAPDAGGDTTFPTPSCPHKASVGPEHTQQSCAATLCQQPVPRGLFETRVFGVGVSWGLRSGEVGTGLLPEFPKSCLSKSKRRRCFPSLSSSSHQPCPHHLRNLDDLLAHWSASCLPFLPGCSLFTVKRISLRPPPSIALEHRLCPLAISGLTSSAWLRKPPSGSAAVPTRSLRSPKHTFRTLAFMPCSPSALICGPFCCSS